MARTTVDDAGDEEDLRNEINVKRRGQREEEDEMWWWNSIFVPWI